MDGMFKRDQILILSYDELQENPEIFQWRIQKFLGAEFPGALLRSNTSNTKGKPKKSEAPHVARKIIEAFFRKKNEELYRLLNSNPGSWMEQHPFSHFEL